MNPKFTQCSRFRNSRSLPHSPLSSFPLFPHFFPQNEDIPPSSPPSFLLKATISSPNLFAQKKGFPPKLLLLNYFVFFSPKHLLTTRTYLPQHFAQNKGFPPKLFAQNKDFSPQILHRIRALFFPQVFLKTTTFPPKFLLKRATFPPIFPHLPEYFIFFSNFPTPT